MSWEAGLGGFRHWEASLGRGSRWEEGAARFLMPRSPAIRLAQSASSLLSWFLIFLTQIAASGLAGISLRSFLLGRRLSIARLNRKEKAAGEHTNTKTYTLTCYLSELQTNWAPYIWSRGDRMVSSSLLGSFCGFLPHPHVTSGSSVNKSSSNFLYLMKPLVSSLTHSLVSLFSNQLNSK